MTDQHPLTDDLCCQIWQDNKDNWLMWQEPCPSTRRIMRAAADWQLEQVIDWASKFGWYLFEHPCQKHEFISELKKAMRPQVVDLPQANSDVCGKEGMERALQRTFEENDELMRKLADTTQ